MPRHSTTLLRRLLADSVLPCAFAALVLTGLLTMQRLRTVDDAGHLQIAVQLEQLAGALEHATDASTQALLDGALRGSRDKPLQRIDLEEADGRRLSSGASADASFERYRRNFLSSSSGRHRILTVHVDPTPRLHAQRLILLYGVLSGVGIGVLVVLATLTLRYRVSMPLRELQRSLDALLDGDNEEVSMDAHQPHGEFARLRASTAALAGQLATHRADWASIQQATAIDALDQLRQSQAAERGKSEFVALVGHHFRQPVQALQLIAASLHSGIDAEQSDLVAQMRSSVATMTRLLDALLEISRLDAGVVAATAAPFSVMGLFLRSRAALAEDARQHGIRMAWHPGNWRVHGDAELAHDLLQQLIANAIAHAGSPGRVLIAARRRATGIRIEVRDSGPGIPSIHQQRIFEEFVQLYGEGERHEGYGLGLAIAARLAELLGTQIGLCSELGRGSTFWFELPLASMEDSDSQTDTRRASPAMLPIS
ncbi:MAG TPA: HAMP domain-containing sensor histidine kinase [Rhodanobacter sp.]|nr:HAMP domain-containing sensor histidine kinase [Rhodanobacter sp.]